MSTFPPPPSEHPSVALLFARNLCQVKLAESHGEVAFQRYLSRGPLAMLPLPGGKLASLVWSTTPEHAESLKVSIWRRS